jgi:SAM-dependent methyltransferase
MAPAADTRSSVENDEPAVIAPYSAAQVVKAIASNQVARFAPGLYLRLTGQTGRGDGADETSGDIAGYFQQCIADYADMFGVPRAGLTAFLRGKVILEYGPGDLPGVALLMVALGARKVYCVDRFPLVKLSAKNALVLRDLAAGLSPIERESFERCFRNPATPAEGFDPDRIEYLVRADGLSGLEARIDLVVSRAVLEHVNDLEATFRDMKEAMKPGALAVHQVDLRSHGLHVANPLDFLKVPPGLWRLMHSHKGVPNRWRADRYEQIIRQLEVDCCRFEPTGRFEAEHVEAIRPQLDAVFANTGEDLLAWQGFWLVFEKRAAGRAA